MNNNLKIIVPAYKSEEWVRRTIYTIKEQSYTNFKCIFIDDNSPDDTFDVAKKIAEEDERFIFKKNKKRVGALQNINDGIYEICSSDEDVIVTIDGDDWLADKDVLKYLNQFYIDNKCLITHGGFNGAPPAYQADYTDEDKKNKKFRDYEICKASHLRTFKFKLWRNIKREDLIDPETKHFYSMAWDLAFMFPMLEMAGQRSKHNDRLMYIYNRDNPNSDMYVDANCQLSLAKLIKEKEKYETLK